MYVYVVNHWKKKLNFIFVIIFLDKIFFLIQIVTIYNSKYFKKEKGKLKYFLRNVHDKNLHAAS